MTLLVWWLFIPIHCVFLKRYKLRCIYNVKVGMKLLKLFTTFSLSCGKHVHLHWLARCRLLRS